MAGHYKMQKGVASNDEMLKTDGCPCAKLGLSIAPSAHLEQWWQHVIDASLLNLELDGGEW